ncbi:hypothetical protein SAMN05444000_102257 [Shimia gijangensis]|uniref:Uncharacterized protein n=1 Tax=Shimia gijangensis TaxID=1470563 RepID=A0A1M6D8L6_9RHOB|nr:hypothetical protein [Shimia gijangensis]SHI69533.1 hypothetical protein SAMN05444000_102257 [Shimia gijangensis]
MSNHPGQVEVDALGAELQTIAFPQSLGAFCATQAKVYGDAIAIDYFQDGVQLSYAALHHRSK